MDGDTYSVLTVLFNETTLIGYAKSLSTGGSRGCPLKTPPTPVFKYPIKMK